MSKEMDVSDVEKGSTFTSAPPSHATSHDKDNTPDYSALHCSHTLRKHASTTTQRSAPVGKALALCKTITARSNAGIVDPGPPPDGGIKAWTQVCCGHFMILNTWGMIASFGVFQTYYTRELGMEASSVSWIGSTQMLGHFGLGMFSGRALDAGYYHWVIVPGVILASLGMLLTSLCASYYQFFLAQGLLTGLGCGLQFAPSVSLISTYFSANRSVALATMATGSATGGLLYPTIARQMLPKIGFAWTVRTMGLMMLAIGCCYASLLKPRLPPRKSSKLFELSAFREPAYSLYLIGMFLFCLGVFFAFYYIGAFAVAVVGVSYSTSINLLLIMNGVGLVGRLVPAYVADKHFGPYNTIIPLCAITVCTLYSWTAVRSISSLYLFATFYGLFSAGFQGLFPVVLASLTKDLSKGGTRNGMGFGFVGVASLTGPPIAGALIQRAGGNYVPAQVWGASMMVLGTLCIVSGRICLTGWRWKVRV